MPKAAKAKASPKAKAKKAPAKSKAKAEAKAKPAAKTGVSRERLPIEEHMKVTITKQKDLPEGKKEYRGQRLAMFQKLEKSKTVNDFYQSGGDRGWLRFFVQDGTVSVK